MKLVQTEGSAAQIKTVEEIAQDKQAQDGLDQRQGQLGEQNL